jgi:outer membrane protein assembly factor BamB
MPSILTAQATGNLFWWYQGIENVVSVASIEDQDSDGWPEAVVMSYDAGAPQEDDLLLIKGNSSGYGELIWSTKPYGGLSGGGGWGDQCLSTMTDLSGDNLSDILLGTAWGGRTAFAITGNTGDIMFHYDSYIHLPSGWCYAVNPIEDLNSDGLDEVLAAFGNETRAAFCLDGASEDDATVIWKWSADGDGVKSICSLGDVNQDGYADALAGCGGNFVDDRVVLIDGSSIGLSANLLWEYDTGSSVEDVSPIEDVNGSGVSDALAGGWDYTVSCIEGGSSGTGDVIWQRNIGSGNVVMRVESIPDVNSDGIDDVLVASWDNAIICLDGTTGDYIWNTPTGTLNGGDVWTIYPVPDVDGDGVWDVVAGSFDTKVYLASGATGDVVWTHTTGNRLYTVRSIPDVNGDGIADVISGTQMLSTGGRIYCIEGDSQGPWMDVSVIPDTTIINAGSRLGAVIGLGNTTQNAQTVDIWIEAKTPWGADIPIIQVYGLTLQSGDSISPHLTKKIPGNTPEGIYTFYVKVGEYETTVMDCDSFDLQVVQSLGALSTEVCGYPRGVT